MTWLAWRQFRAQTALALAVTLAITAVLVATHGHLAHLHDPTNLSAGYQRLRLFGTALIGAPAFIGAFWGAPLLARDLEAGTHRLVWAQSVTRSRWLAVKLGVAAAVTIVVTAAISGVLTWWSLPLDRVGNRIGTANFGQRGIVPVAYALFALAMGTLFGALMKRTLPAMAATLVGFFVVRFGVQLLVRPHLLPSMSVTSPTTGAWVLSTQTRDGAGHVLSSHAVNQILDHPCADGPSCASRTGVHTIVKIQPASHFWALQSWEMGVFLLLALLLTGLSFWLVRSRRA
jgi:ABC-type transport system involved in multi-copper enzyme maturation permease subunit